MLQLEAAHRARDEHADPVQKVLNFRKASRSGGLPLTHSEASNPEFCVFELKLDGVTFVPEMRKPFDVLLEGLDLENSRGDKI